jgi:hypothetical protein
MRGKNIIAYHIKPVKENKRKSPENTQKNALFQGFPYLLPARRTAAAAGPAGGTAAAAGGSSGFSVPDHAAEDQSHRCGDHQDQNDIDQICREPREHGITSL